ncbi:DUF3817 domain-containing protein [Pseudalkalibacillus berkeleyi]|uniref:DUF3817 domain-containing protein n=1 Tax=Pseudalkalibacillus berkeleyi TaxID=1069813 RepID=A0ABS9H026_9BACL|nr:DUF3817 domain-containing protein [Pseudalkalibacillus berkeleyi]MCF6137431.1 DUF3817 domain-containing protein [Pseudalkalibacillus berkeleyi]
MDKLKTFRIVGFSEGISFLLLLGIAMPLKYFFEYPMAVSIVGAIHGGLFVLYCMMVVYLKFSYNWSIKKAAMGILASVLPFGPFVFDAKLIQNS